MKDITIMLDSKLDLSPILNFLPIGIIERLVLNFS